MQVLGGTAEEGAPQKLQLFVMIQLSGTVAPRWYRESGRVIATEAFDLELHILRVALTWTNELVASSG